MAKEPSKDPGTEIIAYKTDSGEVKLSRGIIRKYLVSGGGEVSDAEVMMFLSLCRYQKLNPFLREAYLIKYSQNQPAACVVGKEVFTTRAANNEQFDGFSAGVYVTGETGELTKRDGSLVLPGETIVGGWAEVHRKTWALPVTAAVAMEEYIGRKADNEPNRQWKAKPATMIRKVALVQALREAFPREFKGMYDIDEVDTGGFVPPTTEVKVDAEVVATEAEVVDEPEEQGNTEETTDAGNPDYIPRAEAMTEKDLKEQTQMCRNSVRFLQKQKVIDDVAAATYTKEITDRAAKTDVAGLFEMNENLKSIFMESLDKKLEGAGQ